MIKNVTGSFLMAAINSIIIKPFKEDTESDSSSLKMLDNYHFGEIVAIGDVPNVTPKYESIGDSVCLKGDPYEKFMFNNVEYHIYSLNNVIYYYQK